MYPPCDKWYYRFMYMHCTCTYTSLCKVLQIFPNNWKLLSSGFNKVVFSSIEYCPMCDGQCRVLPSSFNMHGNGQRIEIKLWLTWNPHQSKSGKWCSTALKCIWENSAYRYLVFYDHWTHSAIDVMRYANGTKWEEGGYVYLMTSWPFPEGEA